MVGQTVSHYHLIQLLGSGGMGDVYLAEDLKLRRQVAIKFPDLQVLQDPEFRQRFLREARAAAKLNHPNICTIHSIEEDNRPFIVMEYIRGQTVQHQLGSGPLPVQEAVRIAKQVCEGLQAAHQHHIIHRDIKPGNIMVGENGQVKIMDFGLAQLLGQTRLTREGNSPGTVVYMSFEQANGSDVDHRTDIWSLGVVLYEMLTGKLPFPGDADPVVIYSILNKEPVSIDNTDLDIPDYIKQIIFKALQKDREKRYQTIADLYQDFVHETKHPLSDNHENPVPKRAGHKRPFFIATGIVALLLLIGVLYVMLPCNHRIQSIAVLPLENLSGDPKQKYLVEGMQDALITQLSQIHHLRVISKTSTLQFTGTGKSIPEIVKLLNVDALLEGSVLLDQNQIRITAQLIDGATDSNIWADSYDRELKQVLPLISEIARAIVHEIQVTVSDQELEQMKSVRSADIRVHELVFKGRYYFDRFQFRKSLEAYQQAAELDPEFAPAYAGMAMSMMIMGFFGWEPVSEMIPRARETVLKSLKLDDSCSIGIGTLGYIQLYYDRDWESSRKNLIRALQLSPNDALMRHTYADYLLVMGDVEASLKQVRIGHLYDPLSPIANMALKYHLFLTPGHEEEVMELCKKSLESDADDVFARQIIRDLLWQKGRYEESLSEFRKSWGKDKIFLNAIEQGYQRSGPQGAILSLAESVAERVPEYNDYLALAQLYVQAGDHESALYWLEHAYTNRQFELLHLKACPIFQELHSDPRFQDLLRRIGFPEDSEL